MGHEAVDLSADGATINGISSASGLMCLAYETSGTRIVFSSECGVLCAGGGYVSCGGCRAIVPPFYPPHFVCDEER